MKRGRKIYRLLKTVDEAGELLLERLGQRTVQPETVRVRDALGRVLASAPMAKRSVPSFHQAAMDGIAVRASDTFGALPERPVVLPKEGECSPIDTGEPMPEFADAVVMIEKIEDLGDSWEIRDAVYPWQNVRKVGEDMVKGEIILPARTKVRAYDQAALLAAGVLEVEVFARPRALIIPTGTELVLPEDAPEELPPGALLEFNGQMLVSLAEECGAEATLLKPVEDEPEALKAAVAEGLAQGYDLILINAGSSTGKEDFTPDLLDEMGEVYVHGVTVMPGKPTVLAEVSERPVFGIPGYPVSAVISFNEFVRPAIYLLQGLVAPEPAKVPVSIGRKLPSKLGLEEHVRVILGRVGHRVAATPLMGGAGVITSLTRADGIIRIPQELSGLAEGEEAVAELLKPPEAIENTLLAIGSHDLTLDLIASLIKERTSGRAQLSSTNVGSLGGLMALRRGAAHIAGSHLLDTETGEYNLSYIERFLKGVDVTVITLAHRWQGLMVRPGNPKNIGSVADLAGEGVVFVNRQAGSGTRILLDYELNKAGVDPVGIAGYPSEEYSHMNVAVAVLSGAADAGMGIRAAASALGLDFIPITKERYDLVIPTGFMEDGKIGLLLEIINSRDFKERVEGMGGYEVEETGNTVARIPE